MKVLAIALACVLIVGCADSPMDHAKQDYVCKDNGGVYRYAKNKMFSPQCMDGTFGNNWVGLTLTPEYYPKKEKTND